VCMYRYPERADPFKRTRLGLAVAMAAQVFGLAFGTGGLLGIPGPLYRLASLVVLVTVAVGYGVLWERYR
jgi:hypothetical protein